MYLHEILARLKLEGVNITPHKLRYTWKCGRVSPPVVDLMGNHRYNENHVREVLEYIKHPPKRGKQRREKRVLA